VKLLIRFKCVCKSWFSLISDPHFANSHFQLKAATHTRILLSVSDSQSLQIRSVDFEPLLNEVNLNFRIPHSNFCFEIKGSKDVHLDWITYCNLRFEIRGSCRGFILVCYYTNIYLWNPSTGFRKQIPLSFFYSSNLKDHYRGRMYGFGYDQSRDDYLVVSLCCDLWPYSSHWEFFSLRDDTWKQIEGEGSLYKSHCTQHKVGFLFNGAIHWLTQCFDFYLSVHLIVAFDLMERKLLEMHLPDYYDGILGYCRLSLFGEFLSLCENYHGKVKIWVMKEYKVHSSWTKTLVILNDDVPDAVPHYFTPMYSTKNGDIIGTTNKGNALVKYNDKGQLLGYCSYCDDPDGSQVVMYTESLLSLPGDADPKNAGSEIFSFTIFLIFIIIFYYELLGGCICRIMCLSAFVT